jgi:hypothetical protein
VRLGKGFLDGQQVCFAEAFARHSDLTVRSDQENAGHIFQPVIAGGCVRIIVEEDGERNAVTAVRLKVEQNQLVAICD